MLNNNNIERLLWGLTEELYYNLKLKSFRYSIPVLGLIFLCYADNKLTLAKEQCAQFCFFNIVWNSGAVTT